jgi:glycosyl transferase family 25
MESIYHNSQFCFVVASFNNEMNIKKNIESLITQTNTNWRCIYVNDCSTDNTESLFFDIVRSYNVESKFTYIINDKRYGQAYSKYTAYKMLNDFEIVCLLDGDDWLSDDNVLTRLTILYSDQNVQMLSSNFNTWEDGRIRQNNIYTYPENTVVNKEFRNQTSWLPSHLKTGYAIFFKSIPKEYLKLNNEWLRVCTDVAEYYSALELSKGKYLAIDDIMYTYNRSNSILYETSYFREESREFHKNSLNHILSLPACKYEFPPTYIINMAKCTKKCELMNLQMSFQSNTSFTFIEAIDGSTNSEIDALMKKYLKYMNVTNDSQHVSFNSSIMVNSLKNKYNFKRQHITKGSLGLIQSALLLLSEFVKSDADHALILEDDVYTLQNLNKNLFINKELLKGKDLVYLGCHTSKHDIFPEKSDSIFIDVLNYESLIYGTYSIIISKQLAQYILDIGVNKILRLNLSWDLILNYIRDTEKYRFTFFVYFKQLFIPNVIKRGGINPTRDLTFYTKNKVLLHDYYIPGSTNELSEHGIANIMLMHNEDSFFEFVNKIVYINLEHRVDRKEHIEAKLLQYVNTDKIIRFNAVKHKNGAVGCGLSHIAVLEMAIAENWDNVFIAEDDLTWTDEFINGYDILEKIIRNNYDTIVLGGTFIKSYKNSFKLISCNCALAYIVNKSYYQTLITCFKNAVEGLIQTSEEPIYAIDQAWKTLQNQDNWYIIKPNMCIQMPGYSNIQNDFKDYTTYFHTGILEYEYEPNLDFSKLRYENDDRFKDNQNTNWHSSKHLDKRHLIAAVEEPLKQDASYSQTVVTPSQLNANTPINYNPSRRRVGFFSNNTIRTPKTK